MVKNWVLKLKDSYQYQKYAIEEMRMCLYECGNTVNKAFAAAESLERLRKVNPQLAEAQEPIYRKACKRNLASSIDVIKKVNKLSVDKNIEPICNTADKKAALMFCKDCVDEIFGEQVTRSFNKAEYERLVDILLRIEEDRIRERGERADDVLQLFTVYDENRKCDIIDAEGFEEYCSQNNVKGWREQYPDFAQDYDYRHRITKKKEPQKEPAQTKTREEHTYDDDFCR